MTEPISASALRRLPPRGVLAFAVRCVQRVAPLPSTPLIPEAVERAIMVLSDQCAGKRVKTDDLHYAPVNAFLSDPNNVETTPFDEELDTIYYALLRVSKSVSQYCDLLRDRDCAVDNFADAKHDGQAFAEDREEYEAAIERCENEMADLSHSADVVAAECIAEAVSVFAMCEELIYASGSPDLHADTELMARQYRDSFQAAAETDFETLLSLIDQNRFDDFTVIIPRQLGEVWPDGVPDWWNRDDAVSEETSPPLIAVAWSPEFITEDEYAELIAAIGDLVRSRGGQGVERLRSTGFGMACNLEVVP